MIMIGNCLKCDALGNILQAIDSNIMICFHSIPKWTNIDHDEYGKTKHKYDLLMGVRSISVSFT